MDEDRVLELSKIINKKRIEYFNQHLEMPDTIILNSRQLVDLRLYYLQLIEKDIRLIYGMVIYIDNKKVINDEDIEVLKIGE